MVTMDPARLRLMCAWCLWVGTLDDCCPVEPPLGVEERYGCPRCKRPLADVLAEEQPPRPAA